MFLSINSTMLVFLLPNRMTHALAAHQVHVQVENNLPAVRTGVDDQTVAILVDVFSFCKLFGDREELSHEWLIFRVDVVDRCDVFVWHDQDVRGGDRVNIEKGGYSLVFVNDGGRGFPVTILQKMQSGMAASFDGEIPYYIHRRSS